jgi:indole-3-glycerol phosphate synthase
VPTYLDRIGAWHRDAALLDRRNIAELAAEARAAAPARGFVEALRFSRSCNSGGPAIAIVAEVKRRSPSKGDIAPQLDPVAVALDYAAGGAACLSVLTDGPHFGGSREDLELARAAVSLPVLRKDFTVAAADVYDARIMGADAVLLIVALLAQDELAELFGLAGVLGLDALVEVHDEAELERALAIGAGLIGVNQRDLHTFRVDPERAGRVAAHIPGDVVKVAESGVDSPAEVAALAQAGFDAVLVGESLLRSPDRRAAVAALLGRAVPCG